MREVDPTPRTSHVTPPFWELSTLAAAIGRWGLARFSALPNAPGCVCDARPGCGTKPCPPPRPYRGNSNMPRRCSSSSTESPSQEVVGSGRGHARPFPKWGTSCQLFLSPSSNGVFSGSPGRLGSGTASALRGVKAYVRLSPLPWSPLSVPSYPPRCGGGPVHPPFPTAHLRPPLPWHALYMLYYVYASACPVCGMGAWGVCVVSGCECSLRVGSVGLPRLVAGCASVRAWACPYQRLEKGGGHGL